MGEDAAGRTLVWALTTARLVVLWTIVVVLVAVLAAEGWQVAVRGVDDVSLVGVAAVVMIVIVTLLRGVVAVVIDPLEGTVMLFRAAGGTVRTRLERVRTIDRGWQAGMRGLSSNDHVPVRIVTGDGTARLSWLFPRPEEVVDALADLGPDVRVDL